MPNQTSILIVDDEVNLCNTLSKILTMKGYQISTAESGFRALDLIKEKQFDVVLMDIKMPVMNGIETFKQIKAIKPGSIIILMTAFSIDDLIRDAIRDGVYAVISKPFDIDTVISMIEKSKTGALLAVVGDDPEICKTMRSILEKKGYSVTTCATGEEAISITKERPFDIIFIDMKLPLLNGLETYLKIKKINPKAIAVMMTAYRQETNELIKQAIEKGAYSCLYKPFDMNEVIRIIEEVSQRIQKLKGVKEVKETQSGR